MFNIAKDAFENKPSLKKVVVMNLIPRCDVKKNDPHGIKPVLANIYKSESPHKVKIYIGSYDLDCAGKIQEDRYWNRNNDKQMNTETAHKLVTKSEHILTL